MGASFEAFKIEQKKVTWVLGGDGAGDLGRPEEIENQGGYGFEGRYRFDACPRTTPRRARHGGGLMHVCNLHM